MEDQPLATALDSLAQIPAPFDSNQFTLVEQLTQWARRRIDERVFRPGMRMPSIRQLAVDKGVSRFTVVEAYERLVATGYLESRRGSGFYVREQRSPVLAPKRSRAVPTTMDVTWLLNAMLQTTVPEKGPGLGYLPNAWLDGEMLANGLRSVARRSGALLQYAVPQGYAPLRQQLQTRLAEIEIAASPEQIVLLSGVTQGLDLVARLHVAPGDAVMVGDPAWFQMFGRFAAQGARLIGFPYTSNGPDLDALEALAKEWRPKLLVINSALQNPTGTSLSAAQAFRILQIAERYDFKIVEDDIYGDLCPMGASIARLASLDQLKRVIYLSSFSKTLAANLRVGYLACEAGLARRVADQKMLVGFTTPEINERLVYQILTEGHYRRHVERLRQKLDQAREPAARKLERVGLRLFAEPNAGMFLWADARRDSSTIAAAAHEAGFLFAPGALFSPSQTPSSWMRFNVANLNDPLLFDFLARQMDA
ncbi:aminotransferase-like domain-containing protein [Chitinasiproducens palmae]|uniref:DNA-binding transcriptional regulator, MocR family, contains an aminotransferase domain n=1 Tax=Chitinasiproducens palmae TaxID=1770053 RepID=A0A1H2PVN2_9BURK|nr:PLP-dependent aminotransferase family protein [Chitinasiproducens palmae]SDV50934.1 DNA-binding transcriptional regulator, MocR family, contains an aminotransferase domain [Chitinasiproducens palmae]